MKILNYLVIFLIPFLLLRGFLIEETSKIESTLLMVLCLYGLLLVKKKSA